MESKKKITHFLFTASLVLPLGFLCFLMFGSAVKTAAGILAFQMSPPAELREASLEQVRNTVQSFFRPYKTAVHLDDIIELSQISNELPNLSAKDDCFKAEMIAFVPVEVTIPYYGRKIFEWCLKIK